MCEWVDSSLALGSFLQLHPSVWWVHRFYLSETKHCWPLILEVLTKMILSFFKKRVDLGPYACWFHRVMLAVAVNCNLLMSRQISTSGITVMFPIGFFTAFIIIGTIPLWQSPKQRDEHQSNATCSCSLFPAVRSICGSKGAQEGAF